MDAAVRIDSTRAIVHFAEATTISDAKIEEFWAKDADGLVACTAAQAAGTCVTLTFVRPVKPPATVTYGYFTGPTIHLKDEGSVFAPAVQLPLNDGAPPKNVRTAAPNGAGIATKK